MEAWVEMSAGERVVGSSIARGAFVTGPIDEEGGKGFSLRGRVAEAYQKGDAKGL